MKHLLLTSVTIAALTAPALAQSNQSVIRDGERHLTPKDKSTQNENANLIQNRAIEMGFYSWPMPKEKVAVDQTKRPHQVSSCGGHDPEYRPAHDFSAKEDPRVRKLGQARAFVYEWMAYGNAIEAQDCSCATLTADWGTAVSSFEALVKGVDNFRLYTAVPHRMRNGIKRDYDQMCDIRMVLDLE